MCNERERLIEYVYDECDAEERDRVNRHLETCATCRDEIAGLRATRQDLLAWEVPDHGSVWKPFAPARLRPWWREVPAWAMAAAAGIMFFIGVSGGVTAQVLMARPPAEPAAAAPAPAVTVSSTSETVAFQAELAALQQKIITLATQADLSRLDRRVQAVSTSRETSAGLLRASDASANLSLYSSMSNDIVRLSERFRKLEDRVARAEAYLASQPGAPVR